MILDKRRLQNIQSFLKASPVGKGGLLLLAEVIVQAAGFISGIWIAGLLTKVEYGAYRLLLTTVGYCRFLSMGIPQAVLFKLPVAIGQGNKKETIAIPSGLHTFLIFSRSLILSIAVVFAICRVSLNSIHLQWAWILVGLMYALNGWNGLFEMLFRSHQRFGTLGIFRIIMPVCYLMGLALFLPSLKINGILIATIIAGLAQLVMGIKKYGSSLRLNLDIKRIWGYMKFGLPITWNSFVWLLITSSTIWVVTSFLSPEQTGIFGFAMLIATAYKVMPGIISEMFHPRLLAYYGRMEKDDEALNRVMVTASLAWAGANVLPAAFSLLVFDGIVQYFLPKYIEAWGAMLFIVIGYYCYHVATSAGDIVILRGQTLLLLFGNVLAFLAQLGLALIIANLTSSLFAVSAAPMMGLLISGLVIFYVAFLYKKKKPDILRDIFKILWAMFFGSALIVLIWWMLRIYRGWHWIIIMALASFLICLPQTIMGYANLKRLWKITA